MNANTPGAKPYTFTKAGRADSAGQITIWAHNYFAAVRRVRGYMRGELDIEGRTILAEDRDPPGLMDRKRVYE
jgi:hypothetical protein